ncbi:DUF262 domain-containing protein [Flavobacterium sp. GP15]|uniref:DUF262 domain-containing protein n=1 Tax=Flavobacterium sp. GP15 TaxID=2758567 RepID=UPI00165D553C|nr:DUF262 domain-containing protein [Flavobacterium sp. GP15]
MSENLGKKYSFCQLLKNSDSAIVIPLIQRDYVQGKKNKKEVRQDFLKTLFDYFEKGQNQDLDFVYGYSKDNEYIPLDGQQRLTTLFLLHTYLAGINGNESKSEWVELVNRDNQFKFRYEVRRSSTEFCKGLVNQGINFVEFEEREDKDIGFEKYVQNLHWYKLSWNLDPTVCSMINMLFEIHIMFKDKQHFYELLFSDENPVLTFQFLDLENLKQGDELYIKMNARGKMLTSFENFKARFEEKIGLIFKDKDESRTLSYDDVVLELNTKEYFSFKIDSVWSNLFWNYRHLVGDPNNYDDEIFNFIKEILLYHFFKNNSDSVILDEVFKSKLETFNQLNDFELINKRSINYLIEVLDALQYDNNGIKTFCSNRYFDEEKLFKLILERKIQNPDRVKFYAYLQYLLNKDFEKSGLQDWMRIVVNLVENKIINSQDMIVAAFKSIDNLVLHADVIIEYLIKNPSISFFEANQVTEEKIKAQILKENPDYFHDLYRIEQSTFHAGQIGYLLEVSGVLDNCDFLTNSLVDPSILENIFQDLKLYSQKAIALFNFLDINEDFLFERGMLTYGNYLIKKGDNQYNFSSSKKAANYERDYSWKRILSLDFKNLAGSSWSKKRKLFYQLFDDSEFDFSNVKKSLKNRIHNYNQVDNWKYDFIKDSRYIEACRQGFIYTKNKFKDIQLLNASQMNHLRVDYHVFKFWNETDLGNFEKFSHCLQYVKGNYEIPCVSTNGIMLKKKNYAVQFYNMEDNDFYVRLYKFKGYNRIEDYDDELKGLLIDLGLLWNDSEYNKGFSFNSSNYKNVTLKYLQILTSFN